VTRKGNEGVVESIKPKALEIGGSAVRGKPIFLLMERSWSEIVEEHQLKDGYKKKKVRYFLKDLAKYQRFLPEGI